MFTLLYSNIVDSLIVAIPEYAQSRDFLTVKSEIDLPYIIFGNLYSWAVSNIEIEAIKKLTNFLETVASLKNPQLGELLMFGFLENINPKSDTGKKLLARLGPQTMLLYNQILESQ